MIMTILRKETEQIKKDEGLRLKPYYDSEGCLSIGYGINLDNGITKNEADILCSMRVANACGDLWKVFTRETADCLANEDPERAGVFVNMIYNLGSSRFLSFKRMIEAVERKDWETASKELLDSKYARQVGHRALRLAERLRG